MYSSLYLIFHHNEKYSDIRVQSKKYYSRLHILSQKYITEKVLYTLND
jgi:hypothetical protein